MAPHPFLSPVGMRYCASMLRCWRANTGKGQPAILGPVAGRPYFLCLGRLCLPGQREAPLVQRGDSMAQPCRGDCEAGGMIQLVFYCRVRELAVNPSVGVRRQLPLHKGAVFAFLHRTCRARQRSLAVRTPDPPCAKGGQHGAAMQGGLRSRGNDFGGCCDRVREHRLAVPTRDRQHSMRAQALGRRRIL